MMSRNWSLKPTDASIVAHILGNEWADSNPGERKTPREPDNATIAD